MRQKQMHRQSTEQCLPRGEAMWRDRLGVWDWQMQAIICKMGKQGPIVQHRELYSISYDKKLWKKYEKECIAESLFCMVEISTTLQIHFRLPRRLSGKESA